MTLTESEFEEFAERCSQLIGNKYEKVGEQDPFTELFEHKFETGEQYSVTYISDTRKPFELRNLNYGSSSATRFKTKEELFSELREIRDSS